MTSLHVIEASGLSLVQDRGRGGWQAQGVGRSGAADLAAHALGQRLVGNPTDAAAIETLLGPLHLRAQDELIVAVTGAVGDVVIGGRLQDRNRAQLVRAGQEIRVGPAVTGARLYLSVRGGIDVAPVLGSRSRDTLGGLGPAPLTAGDLVPVGAMAVEAAWFEVVAALEPPALVDLDLLAGPHDDVLDDAGWSRLRAQTWAVSADSDRIGVRLDGDPLPAPAADLPSFPVVVGSVQLPPHGRPIVLGRDAGVTGGYPVIGVADEPSLDRLAQARPGTNVRFRRGSGRPRPRG